MCVSYQIAGRLLYRCALFWGIFVEAKGGSNRRERIGIMRVIDQSIGERSYGQRHRGEECMSQGSYSTPEEAWSAMLGEAEEGDVVAVRSGGRTIRVEVL